MADDIEALLHLRTDLSTFIVHFTRDSGEESKASDNLLNILGERTIKAVTPFGMAADLDADLEKTTASQRAVCFSETPLEHCWTMVREISKRKHKLAPYGVVFTKSFARRQGCNPVWYLDITRGHPWLTVPIKDLVAEAKKASEDCYGNLQAKLLAEKRIFRLTPFIEQMGNPSGTRKEFWWEREWRHVGDYTFQPKNVVALLAPTQSHATLCNEITSIDADWNTRQAPLLDPRWGLERMISTLSDIDPKDAGPWPE